MDVAPADICDDLGKLAEEALNKGTKVLGGVALTESTTIGEILKAPADYDGKKVRIEGFVSAICTSQGCWTTLQDLAGDALNLKVVDGVVDLRTLAEVGQYGVGEGVFNTVGEHGAQGRRGDVRPHHLRPLSLCRPWWCFCTTIA